MAPNESSRIVSREYNPSKWNNEFGFRIRWYIEMYINDQMKKTSLLWWSAC